MEINIEPRISELNKNEVLLYLGYKGQNIDDLLDEQIDACIEKVVEAAEPRVVFRQLAVENGGMVGFPVEGSDVAELLRTCHEALLLGATIGPKVDMLISREMVLNMADAVIIDSCASVCIENVCNNFEADLREMLEAEGLYLTDRFSPGYGDLPLDTQPRMSEALNMRRRIGVSVGENFMMSPTKSVTAIMGISREPQPLRAKGCEVCNMFKTCEFRKKGMTCHG